MALLLGERGGCKGSTRKSGGKERDKGKIWRKKRKRLNGESKKKMRGKRRKGKNTR